MKKKSPVHNQNNQNTQIDRRNSYLYDYIQEDNHNPNEKCYMIWFLTLLTTFFFVFSCVDLSYSYLKLDPCQFETDDDVSLTLNIWLRISGFYGIFYYFFLLIAYLKFKPYTDNYIRNPSVQFEIILHCYKFMTICFTVLGTIVSAIGMYSFISFYSHNCNDKRLIYYLWPRVCIQLLSYLSMFITIPLYIFK
jgi:hypothetical protein